MDIVEVNEPEVNSLPILYYFNNAPNFDFHFQMYVSIKFVVWLRWKDDRLIYQNLDNEYYLNKIAVEDAERLWKPSIIFKNSNENQMLEFNPASGFFVEKDGDGKEAPLGQMFEEMNYPPKQTAIIWKSVHLLKFRCHFDLFYLPFDNQTCYVEVSFSAYLKFHRMDLYYF